MTHSDPKPGRAEPNGGYIGEIMAEAHREARSVRLVPGPPSVHRALSALYDVTRTEILADTLDAYAKIVAEWPDEIPAVHGYLIAMGIDRALDRDRLAVLALLSAALDALHTEQTRPASQARTFGRREVLGFVEGWVTVPHAAGAGTASALLDALRERFPAVEVS